MSYSIEYVKKETARLYDELPQVYEERIARIDVRDRVIDLNYTFFGYVASHTFINNSMVTYEDKLQSAVLHFCECWWKWKFEGDEERRGYRQDLSFAVFFKPRISEMIERELSEVKYSLRRSLCMEVGSQIGKHWGKVTYDDLSDPRVKISADKMTSLKAIFGTLYEPDMEEHTMYLEAPKSNSRFMDTVTDEYDSVEELLVSEMIRLEEKLTDNILSNMSYIYQIDFWVLKSKLPYAEQLLYNRLHESKDISESYR